MKKPRIMFNRFERTLIDEISTLSGYPESQVRQILELTFLRQLECLLSDQPIRIPFIGNLATEFVGDKFIAGNRVAEINCTLEPSELYSQLVGDIVDGESDILKDFLDAQTEAELEHTLERG